VIKFYPFIVKDYGDNNMYGLSLIVGLLRGRQSWGVRKKNSKECSCKRR